MMKTKVIEQMEFVNTLAKRLSEAVTLHEKRREEKSLKHHGSVAEWGVAALWSVVLPRCRSWQALSSSGVCHCGRFEKT